MTQQEQNTNIDEWHELQNDWQSYKPDIQKIKKRITWVTWRMIAVLILDLIVLFAYVPFIIFFVLIEGESLAIKVWHLVMLPVIFYAVYWDFKLRLPLFKLDSESTKDILAFYLKRVTAGVKLGNFSIKFCLSLLVFYSLWISASFYFDLGEEKLHEPSFILFGLGWIGCFTYISYWYRNKKLKELTRLNALWKTFLE